MRFRAHPNLQMGPPIVADRLPTDMLSTMHLGSVLVGIVIGLILGALIGWYLGGRRVARSSTELLAQPPSAPHPPPPRPARVSAPAFSPRTAVLFAESAEQDSRGVFAGAAPRFAPATRPPEPELHNDEPLLEVLRAANKRLNDEARTRLSRESPDVPPAPESVPAGPPSQGHDLLELSRRLAEDGSRRLAREGEPEPG